MVATTKVGRATATATVGPGGGEVKAEYAVTSVAVTAGDGHHRPLGLGRAGRLRGEDRARRQAGTWSKWELGLRVALVGTSRSSR